MNCGLIYSARTDAVVSRLDRTSRPLHVIDRCKQVRMPALSVDLIECLGQNGQPAPGNSCKIRRAPAAIFHVLLYAFDRARHFVREVVTTLDKCTG